MKKRFSFVLLLCLSGTICFFSACKKQLPPVEIKLEVSDLGGDAPFDVNASCEVVSGQVTGYSWDFGDGGSASGSASAFHRYTTAGEYTLRLTVTGIEGSENNPETVTKTATATISVYQPNTPPVAGFQFSPSANIIADNTYVNFSNTSSGTVTAWQWDFGTNETGTTEKNPAYRFNYAGTKTVRLTASGPLGTNAITKTVTVHAMDPTCNNYTGGATQSASAIQSIRNNNQLKVGKPVIENNYANSVKIELFHPDEWLNGSYSPYANVYWSVNGSATNTLVYNGQSLYIGDDWGVRVSFSNGVVSCIRTVKDVATFSGGNLTIKANKIYNGY